MVLAGAVLIVGTTLFYITTIGKERSRIER